MNLSVKRLALAAIAAAVLCIGPASAASAAEPAVWSPQQSMRQSGALEFRYYGGSPVTCQIKAEGAVSGGLFNAPFLTPSPCSNGKSIIFTLFQAGQKEGTKYSVIVGGSPYTTTDPWGGAWQQQQFSVPFTNGSGTKMSTLTFSKTNVGAGGAITATGTLTATTLAGGLITLK